jgi:hypothetical protein
MRGQDHAPNLAYYITHKGSQSTANTSATIRAYHGKLGKPTNISRILLSVNKTRAHWECSVYAQTIAVMNAATVIPAYLESTKLGCLNARHLRGITSLSLPVHRDLWVLLHLLIVAIRNRKALYSKNTVSCQLVEQ